MGTKKDELEPIEVRKARYRELFSMVKDLMSDGSRRDRYIGMSDEKDFYSTDESQWENSRIYGPIPVSEDAGRLVIDEEVCAAVDEVLEFFDAEQYVSYIL